MESWLALIQSSAERAPWGWALLATVVLALIKVWPLLSKQAIDARAALRKEKRDDLATCTEKCAALDLRVDALQDQVHALETKLVASITGNRLYRAELEAIAPTSPVLKQVQTILSVAFTISPSTPPDMQATVARAI